MRTLGSVVFEAYSLNDALSVLPPHEEGSTPGQYSCMVVSCKLLGACMLPQCRLTCRSLESLPLLASFLTCASRGLPPQEFDKDIAAAFERAREFRAKLERLKRAREQRRKQDQGARAWEEAPGVPLESEPEATHPEAVVSAAKARRHSLRFATLTSSRFEIPFHSSTPSPCCTPDVVFANTVHIIFLPFMHCLFHCCSPIQWSSKTPMLSRAC